MAGGQANGRPRTVTRPRPSVMRAGVLQYLIQDQDLAQLTGTHVVAKIKGSIRETFDFIDADGNERPDWLRNWILSEARAHRNKLASGVENASARGITDFDSSMVRYGKGALGGKGRGFRFLHSVSDKFGLQTIIPELRISVPNCFVLATEVFDRFLDEKQMRQAALEANADEDLVKLALQDEGYTGSCVGTAYRVADEDARQVLDDLDFREKGGYTREVVSVAHAGGTLDALLYRGTVDNPNFDASAIKDLDQAASTIKDAVGPSGPNRDYLLNLATWLEEVGEEDAHVAALVDRIS